jgi:hypothetical protein
MNTYNPKLTLTQIVQHLRYARAERQLRPLCRWVDFYDYIWSYGSIDWSGKTVLDIGAEIGSSAWFFLMNGATYVYMLESSQAYKTTYENLKQRYPILNSSAMLGSLQDIPNIDVLKMDCEGCELELLTEGLLASAKEFAVGLHKPQLDTCRFEQKQRLLEQYGGRYFGSVNNEEFLWIKKI